MSNKISRSKHRPGVMDDAPLFSDACAVMAQVFSQGCVRRVDWGEWGEWDELAEWV